MEFEWDEAKRKENLRKHNLDFLDALTLFSGPIVARVSHHPSTATTQPHTLSGVRSVRVLDIVSTMPARSSITSTNQGTHLSRLATNDGEKCGLANWILVKIMENLDGLGSEFLNPFVSSSHLPNEVMVR